MDFEFSEKCNLALSKLGDFMDEHIYPNETIYHEQHDALENRWETPPLMDEFKAKAQEAGLWTLFLPNRARGHGC